MKLGPRGEQMAADYLTQRGYRVVARNYRCPVGEIDLVAIDDDTVVFVEVKTRSSDEAADPEIAVHPEKRRRLTRAGKHFVARHRLHEKPCRFDVVAIVDRGTGSPQIEHFEDAFPPAVGRR